MELTIKDRDGATILQVTVKRELLGIVAAILTILQAIIFIIVWLINLS